MSSTRIDQYGKIRVGVKTLDDAILDIGALPKIDRYKYNKPFILRALESIPKREDIELIIIDDCSTDKTLEICKQ